MKGSAKVRSEVGCKTEPRCLCVQFIQKLHLFANFEEFVKTIKISDYTQIILKISSGILLCVRSAGDEIQGLLHVKQVLYH